MAETLYATGSPISGSVSGSAAATGAPDGSFTSDTGNTNWTARWNLDDLVGTIAAAQTVGVTIRVRKDSTGGNTPDVTGITLLDNGSTLGSDTTGWAITATGTGTDITVNIPVTGIANNGANLQVEVSTSGAGGAPSSRRAVQLDAISVVVQNASPDKEGTGSVSHASSTTGSGSGAHSGSGSATHASATTGSGHGPITGLNILYVVDDAGLHNPSDFALISVLEGAGHTVDTDTVVDTDPVPGTVGDYDLILIPESVSGSSAPAGTYRTTAVPVLLIEPYCSDEMDIASGQGDVAGTAIDVVDPTHPIAVEAGLAYGSNTILSTSQNLNGATTLGPGVDVIAENPNGVAMVFAYETGAEMLNSLAAPARRVNVLMREAGMDQLTALGEALILAAADYAAGVETVQRDAIAVAASADDGFGFPSSTFTNSSTTLFFGDDGDQSRAFMRFALPNDLTGATIEEARIVAAFSPANSVTADVYADDAADPAAPTTYAELDTGITATTAKATWTTGVGQSPQTSPDLAAVIQELVDSYTMASGDHIVIKIDPTAYTNTTVNEIHSFDNGTSPPPVLQIAYTPGSGSPDKSGSGSTSSTSSTSATGQPAKSGSGSTSAASSETASTSPSKLGSGAASATSSTSGTGTAVEEASGSGSTSASSSTSSSGSGARSGSGSTSTASSTSGSGTAVEAASGSGSTSAASSVAASGTPSFSGAGSTSSSSSASGTGISARSGSGSTSAASTTSGTGSGPIASGTSNWGDTLIPDSAAASSTWSTFAPDNAIEGNAGYWQASAAAGSSWIRFDFGAAVTLEGIQIHAQDNDGFPGAVSVEGSNNDVDWTTIVASHSSRYGTDLIDFGGQETYRYFRVSGLSGSGWWVLDDIRFIETLDITYPLIFLGAAWPSNDHDLAYDGDLGTKATAWGNAGSTRSRLTIDLGSSQQMNRLTMKQEQAEAFILEYTDDPSGSWTTALTVADSTGDEFVETDYDFTAATARYWRIDPTAGGDWTSYYEVNLANVTSDKSGSGSTSNTSGTSATGTPAKEGNGSTSASSTVSGTAEAAKDGSGSTSSTSSTSSTGTGDHSGTGTTSSSSATSGSGTAEEAASGTGSTSAASSTTSTGSKSVNGSGADSAASSIAATGTPQKEGNGSTTSASTTNATATSEKSGTGSASATSATSGTGTASEGAAGGGSTTHASATTANGQKDSYDTGTASNASDTSGTGSGQRSGTGAVSATSATSGTGTPEETTGGTGTVTHASSTTSTGTKDAFGAEVIAIASTPTGAGSGAHAGAGAASIVSATSGTGNSSEAGGGSGSTAHVSGVSVTGAKEAQSSQSLGTFSSDATGGGSKTALGVIVDAAVSAVAGLGTKTSLSTALLNVLVSVTGTGTAIQYEGSDPFRVTKATLVPGGGEVSEVPVSGATVNSGGSDAVLSGEVTKAEIL